MTVTGDEKYLALPGQGYACLGASIGVLSIIYVVFMKRYYGLHGV